MSIVNDLCNIDPGRSCLKFLGERILSDNYRGMQISQHNRYDCEVIVTILDEMYKLVGSDKMKIRTADLKKRPTNTPDEKMYAKYVANLCGKLGRCTQDSVRKNLFVDLHRMGFIYRFNKNGDLVSPHERCTIKYVKITNDGIDLIQTKDVFNRNFIYTKGIEKMTNGLESNLLGVLEDLNNELNIYEFMFFVSYMGQELNSKKYTADDVVGFVKEYRTMSRIQRNTVIETVASYCNPSNFVGKGKDKTDKRDFHNWKNESEQIYMLLNQTVLYEVINKEKLVIKVGEGALFENEAKLKRSYSEKSNYFIKHKINKTPGYQLHHIVSLFIAKNRNEYNSLDVWQNMIYIDGYTHGKIHSTSDTYFKIEFENDNLELIDTVSYKKNKNILCVKDKNILYDVSNQNTMKNYNALLLNSI